MAIGRNDPCPCGSNQKYKKCCFKKDEISRHLASQRRQVEEVLSADATIYRVFSEWQKAREMADFNFLYDLLLESGPLLGSFASRHEFVAACANGTAKIPSGKPASFRHLVISDGVKAKLLQTIGERDASSSSIGCECLHFRKTEQGWRLAGFELKSLKKSDDTQIGWALFEDSLTGSNPQHPEG